MEKMNIGNIIRAYRTYRGMTQEKTAENSGINEKYYGRIERSESIPTFDKFAKICDAMGVNAAELLLMSEPVKKTDDYVPPCLIEVMDRNRKEGITTHLNHGLKLDRYRKSLWYDGYLGSLCYRHYEMSIIAIGDAQGVLYKNYKRKIGYDNKLNVKDLMHLIPDDRTLENLLETDECNEAALMRHNGDALFMISQNRLLARIRDNSIGGMCYDHYLEDDDVLKAFDNRQLLLSNAL